MTPQIAMVFGTFLFMIVFMIWGKIEPCIVVMLSLGFLWFTGILDTATAFGQPDPGHCGRFPGTGKDGGGLRCLYRQRRTPRQRAFQFGGF